MLWLKVNTKDSDKQEKENVKFNVMLYLEEWVSGKKISIFFSSRSILFLWIQKNEKTTYFCGGGYSITNGHVQDCDSHKTKMIKRVSHIFEKLKTLAQTLERSAKTTWWNWTDNDWNRLGNNTQVQTIDNFIG